MKIEIHYTIIRTEEQYIRYCNELEELVLLKGGADEDTIELLTLLIEKWDDKHYKTPEIDPVQLLKLLMEEHSLKAKDLTDILKLSKGTISKILNYKKGISKETIRKLSNHFAMRQEAFNKPYKLKNKINKSFRNAALMNTRKKMEQIA